MFISFRRSIPALALFLATLAPPGVNAQVFVVRKANGKDVRGELLAIDADWQVTLGKGVRHRLRAAEWLSLRQANASLPPLPAEEHLVLTSGDRIPARNLRLDDEKLHFRHPDLNGNKDVIIPLSSVAMIWRLAPDGTVVPSRVRHRLLRAKRKRDQLLLRNGDTLEGTLSALSSEQVEMEVAGKNVLTKWPQVSAVLLSSDLTKKPRPGGARARVVLSSTSQSPGGRLTVLAPGFDETTFRAKTSFGAKLRVPIERVVALELMGGHADSLPDLTPTKYAYTPYLDETYSWGANANVRGRDLTLGGSTYDRGVGMHAGSRTTYSLGGKYRLFDALVGLDDLDGRKGRVAIRVLVDGKAADLGKKQWTHRDGAVRISVSVADAKELTLEVLDAGKGPIQGVVNWVEARLVR